MSTLTIRNLHVSIDGKEILKGLNLDIKTGEIHAIMGPNGTGKSTLSYAIMGHPAYEVTEGEILFGAIEVLITTLGSLLLWKPTPISPELAAIELIRS